MRSRNRGVVTPRRVRIPRLDDDVVAGSRQSRRERASDASRPDDADVHSPTARCRVAVSISGVTVAAKKGTLRVKGRSILRMGPKSHPTRLMLGGDRFVTRTFQSRPGCRRSTDTPMSRHPQEAKPGGRERPRIESGDLSGGSR